MKRTIQKIFLLCGAMLLLTACGAKVTALHVELPDSIVAGESAAAKLTADYDKPDAADEDKAKALEALGVQWSSSDEAVATVDAQGNVIAVDGGTVTITAAGNGKDAPTAAVEITVTVPLTGVSAPKTLELKINKADSGKLDAKPQPENATVEGKPAYKSSDEAVATVDANGTVTAVANGKAVITTTLEGKNAETKVTVKTAATGIALEQGEGGILTVGSGVTLVAYPVPSGAEAGTYTFTCENPKVATVDAQGKVVAVSLGNTKVTVKSSDGHTASYAVVVDVYCTYCKAFGHTSANCSVRIAAEKRAAAAAAKKKPQSSGGGATGSTGGGGTAGGATGGGGSTGGGGGDTAPPPAPAPAPPSTGDGGINWGEDSPTVGVGGGGGHDVTLPD